MGTVAWIIDLYGDAYWPIFERLEKELEIRRERQKKLEMHAPLNRKRPARPERHPPSPPRKGHNPLHL